MAPSVLHQGICWFLGHKSLPSRGGSYKSHDDYFWETVNWIFCLSKVIHSWLILPSQAKPGNTVNKYQYIYRTDWQKKFYQLYTLSADVVDCVFGSLYCLLQKKDRAIYCKIFSFIKHWAMEHGYPLIIQEQRGRLKTDLGIKDTNKIPKNVSYFL